MRKSHGYRKFALLMALVLAAGLTFAACSSSSSSSTDGALSHPGENYIGSIKMVVDPENESIEVTPIADALTDTTEAKTALLSVTTSPASVVFDGAGNITGDVTIKWEDPANHLEDVSIRVRYADATGMGASLDSADNCGAGTLQTALSGGCNPGQTYTGDEPADGAEQEIECAADDCSGAVYRDIRHMPPGCGDGFGGSITATWSMTETATAPAYPMYTFYCYVYATKHPADMHTDPRYDPSAGTYHIKAYLPSTATKKRPPADPASPITLVPQGQWFYTVTWIDSPGAMRPTSDMTCGGNHDQQCNVPCHDSLVSGDGTCWDVVTQNPPANVASNDYFYIEDQVGFDLFTQNKHYYSPGVGNGYWMSYYSYNTQFMFLAGGGYRLQWDPAVLMTNDTQTATKGSGANTFTSGGGTTFNTVTDFDTADAMDVLTGWATNWGNHVLVPLTANYSYTLCAPQCYPPVADGLDIGDYGGGFQQGDYNAGQVAFYPYGPVGSGSRISLSPSGNTAINVGIGRWTVNYGAGPAEAVTAESNNYARYEGSIGIGEGMVAAEAGHYNEQMGYVCIQ